MCSFSRNKNTTLLFIFFLISSSLSLNAQQVFLQGHVYADSLMKPIFAAQVFLEDQKKVVLTDQDGYFKLPIKKRNNKLIIRHIAYKELKIQLPGDIRTISSFFLEPQIMLLDDVIINGADNGTQTSLHNFHQLKKKDLERLPGFLGVSDVIKTVQTLPGIGKGGEGNAALLVRGSSSGQNLTLFNQAIIYNPSHLLGFFSVFNTDAVDDVKFYKSGIPSEYGGRISAVLDIKSSSKKVDSMELDAELSFLAAKVNLKLPITKTWSVSTTMRKTFMNQTIWPLVTKITKDDNNIKYDFYDLNISSTLELSKKDRLFATGYLGGDDFGFETVQFNVSNGMDWQNGAASLNWKRTISDQTTLNNTVTFSSYKFNFDIQQEGFMAKINSAVRDLGYNSTIQTSFEQHHLKAGVSILLHKFKPNTPFARNGNTELDYGSPSTYYSDEHSLFLSDDFRLTERFSFYVGLRLTYYRHKGPYNLSAEDGSTSSYGRNETVSDQFLAEPSFTARFNINTNTVLKLAYSANVQTTHLIPITASNFPSDFWIPATGNLPAEKGKQLSLGIFKDWKDAGYEAYIDVYAKNMNNILEFSGGLMNLFDNLKIEDHVYLGKGNSYGSEFYFKKNKDRLTGYLSYTLSKSDRIFEALNGGKRFPFKYDRTHDFTIVSNYKLSEKWNLSGLFTLATGNTYTKPISRYLISGNVINEYGAYNSSRMPIYHRLDLSANYQFLLGDKYKSKLSFSVYNVYNRANPIFNFYLARGSLGAGKITIQEKSVVLLPILPSINYKIIFK